MIKIILLQTKKEIDQLPRSEMYGAHFIAMDSKSEKVIYKDRLSGILGSVSDEVFTYLLSDHLAI